MIGVSVCPVRRGRTRQCTIHAAESSRAVQCDSRGHRIAHRSTSSAASMSTLASSRAWALLSPPSECVSTYTSGFSCTLSSSTRPSENWIAVVPTIYVVAARDAATDFRIGRDTALGCRPARCPARRRRAGRGLGSACVMRFPIYRAKTRPTTGRTTFNYHLHTRWSARR